jgi:hypothetical protein
MLYSTRQGIGEEMDSYRKKLLNAVLFFCVNTKRCNTTKLLKLLAFLDFTHFKQTGYPSLGLTYYSYPRGPVPKDFYDEIRDGNVPSDFKDKLVVIPKDWGAEYPEVKEYVYKPKSQTKPDLSSFTPREVKIIKSLCEIFHDSTAGQMSEVSHSQNSPWEITVRTKGNFYPIDYLLCIDKQSPIKPEQAKIKLQEHNEMLHNFKIGSIC